MSEEFKIPPDLAVLESQLRSVRLPDSRLNRDQLLYQAGWAAACAQAKQPLTQQWGWPAATGAVTILATVLALMLLQQTNLNDQPDRVASNPVVEQSEPVQHAAKENGIPDHGPDVMDSLPAGSRPGKAYSPIRNVRWQGALQPSLAARSQLENFDWSIEPTIDSTGLEIENGSKAMRELLQEFLPENRVQTHQQPRPPIWNWIKQTWGDAI